MFPWSKPSPTSSQQPGGGIKIVNYNPKAPQNDPSSQCYALRNTIMRSPKVNFLLYHINALNQQNGGEGSQGGGLVEGQEEIAPLLPNELIQCVSGCPKSTNAVSITTSDPKLAVQHGMVGICDSRSFDAEKTATDVTHELIHLYDQMRIDFDYNDCFQTLCTETRASMLSGECAPTAPSSMSGILGTSSSSFSPTTSSSYLLDLNIEKGGFAKCIERNAMKSTRDYKRCKDFFLQHQEPEQLKNLSWTIETCMNDTSPFPSIP